MTNKYLEKIASFVRSPKNIGSRMAQLGMGAANRAERTLGIKMDPYGRRLEGAATKIDQMRGHDKLKESVRKLVTDQPHSIHADVRKTFRDKVGDNPNAFH
jgi:hypothetical protein